MQYQCFKIQSINEIYNRLKQLNTSYLLQYYSFRNQYNNEFPNHLK